MNIGFIGYSSSDFDVKEAREIVENIFKDHISKDDVIVSGATNLGIPKLVYEQAKKNGNKTVGIMCEKGYDYDVFPVDELEVVGQNWGDESEVFLSEIDKLYKIGGGKQSEEEFKKAKERGIESYEYSL